MIYIQGCIDGITNWFNEHLEIVGGVAVGLAVLQVKNFDNFVSWNFDNTLLSHVKQQFVKENPVGFIYMVTPTI